MLQHGSSAGRLPKNTVCTVEKHAAFCTLHRDHTVSFVPDADRDMVYGRESKDIIGLLWKPGDIIILHVIQYDMLHCDDRKCIYEVSAREKTAYIL